jgi:hypothetical protein
VQFENIKSPNKEVLDFIEDSTHVVNSTTLIVENPEKLSKIVKQDLFKTHALQNANMTGANTITSLTLIKK